MTSEAKSIRSSRLEGAVDAPPSKSHMQRAAAAALLAEGTSVLRRPSLCDDAQASLRAVRALGAEVEDSGPDIRIRGGFNPRMPDIDCGEAGLCLRLFSAVAALSSRAIVLSARGSLRQRPMGMIEAPLRRLGVVVRTDGGFPPLEVRGPLRGGEADVDGSVSSQFLSGLLTALPKAERSSLLQISDLKSRPYVDLTLEVLRGFGVRVDHESYRTFRVEAGQSFRPADIEIEGDWSGASAWLAAAAVDGKISVRGLRRDSRQADVKMLEALDACGARLSWEGNTLTVEPGRLRSFVFDAADSPDLFPALAALACRCPGTTRIKGASRLAHKESDRATVLVRELGRIGGDIRRDGDWMEIRGTSLGGGEIDAHGDHRIAMAAAIAALGAREPVRLSGGACVAKSYPLFFQDLRRLGGDIHE
ncbi:MAG: 3-phosphoshikimate 1-carboxyvinyltransferase [Acidobacteria bacterium]|nr:3-phosphoshikimate 1-carboxyvinyltransferase [Acidobacteriota bacterium]OQB57701.1 MAG: 3-phosphoshikimate 1-carboxyvinyltransferase [Candidatus Aminicenantes bacterium ADurb.Bin147]HNQ80864.1 3-phosphoshikimate 1-carboxyvinyltransferase [Candidatus Aminicenantes bacterium]NMD11515.1 3-phosphoshikimate 1-carboxyvinyltransferase [Acidobacteriota bacterium]HNT31130.1 3-phosphoshikimate 1-carboxyvinyltransferase [Candidatus Aminicenantes bacterium]